MSAAPLSHPDRLATTLATLPRARQERPAGDFAAPGAGAADCRIDGKLFQWHALRAAERSEAAAKHLATYGLEDYPELWAGTVQDGVARGFLVHLEETCSLAAPSPQADWTSPPEEGTTEFTGTQLRKKKDILIASGGCRVRFSRRGGLLFVDREHDINSQNSLWFEARRDVGTLDGFVGADDERTRLFSAQFLKPSRLVQGKQFSKLELSGRLGRSKDGWPCRISILGHADRDHLTLTIEIANSLPGWRLRSRFLGIPADRVHHHCMPVREQVQTDVGSFIADTLVRPCATLLVDGQALAVPDAAAPGLIRHTFSLGNLPA